MVQEKERINPVCRVMRSYSSKTQYNKLYTQNSADSAFSNPSSDLSLDEEKQALRREKEREALSRLEQARTKPVAFGCRTNVAYNGVYDDECPLPGYALKFNMREYLQIRDKYDENWWIGRIVKEGSDMGFVPSPLRLEALKALQLQNRNLRILVSGLSSSGNLGALASDLLTPVKSANFSGSSPPSPDDEDGIMGLSKEKRKAFFKKNENVQPFQVVPCVRPVVLVGPSLKGYEVTDMMQKAIFDFLKRKFESRIIMTRVGTDISQAKRTFIGYPKITGTDKNDLADRGEGLDRKIHSNLTEVEIWMEKIYEYAKTLQLVVLDCDTVNHPSQLMKTNLSPIIVYIKISSPKVLQRLIKSRGKNQTRYLNVQMVAAEKLSTCPPEMFDVILDENQLEEACEHLGNYLEAYWRATHPANDGPIPAIGQSSSMSPDDMQPRLPLHSTSPPVGTHGGSSSARSRVRIERERTTEFDDYDPNGHFGPSLTQQQHQQQRVPRYAPYYQSSGSSEHDLFQHSPPEEVDPSYQNIEYHPPFANLYLSSKRHLQ